MERSRRLTVFPDTNLFLQCRTLQELPWRELGDFSEIEVLVPRPVQKEIDLHKSGGNDRRQRRARDASSLLRSIITDRAPLLIRDADPQVTLSLRLDLRPDPTLASTLNYAEPDDILVGIAHGFAASDLDLEVAILTDDTGVMASASATQLNFKAIPEHWRLQVPSTNEAKELKAAHAEIKKLQLQEPIFRVRCSEDVERKGALEFEVPVAHPLTKPEIDSLLEIATSRFPKKQDFSVNNGRSPKSGPQGIVLASLMGLDVPPTTEQIAAYNRAYDRWTEEMARILTAAHRILLAEHDVWPKISFIAENVGTRPANDVFVEIVATGLLQVSQDERQDQDIESLPSPPAEPKGALLDMYASFRAMENLAGGRKNVYGYDVLMPRIPKPREAEGFYYRKRDFTKAHERLELDCELWRHGLKPETFTARLNLSRSDKGRGAIEFRIHASNLSQPVCETIPVELTTKHLSTFEYARDLIQRLRIVPFD